MVGRSRLTRGSKTCRKPESHVTDARFEIAWFHATELTWTRDHHDAPAAPRDQQCHAPRVYKTPWMQRTGVICCLHRTGVICCLQRTGVICCLQRTGVICCLHRTGVICCLHQTGVLCCLQRTGVLCCLQRTGVICLNTSV